MIALAQQRPRRTGLKAMPLVAKRKGAGDEAKKAEAEAKKAEAEAKKAKAAEEKAAKKAKADEEKAMPIIVKQPEKPADQRKGCDAGCMGRGKKSKALPQLF